MTTAVIRKKLVDYLQTADDSKVKAIYTMVSDEINTNDNGIDDGLFAELEKRSKTLKNGTAKTYTWEETKQAAIDRMLSHK